MNPLARSEFIFQVRHSVSILSFLACALLISMSAPAQQESSPKRKVLNQTATPYPALARPMALAGVVKVEAVVAPDGTVKALDVKGGHPVLAQAAANAIRQWKWETASQESHELIEIRFRPPE